MSRTQRHIKKQSNITNEESYAILQEPTNATFISKETMETNAKTEGIRQAGEVVYVEPKLVEDTETEGQKKAQSFSTTMENETNFYAETYV
jgi:hypothetical protein